MSAPSPPLLVVDPILESRVILHESLGHGGINNRAVARLVTACEQIDREAVLAVLVDLDHLTTHELHLVGRKARRAGVVVFAIGTNRPPISSWDGVFVRKPYHYRDLILKIESTLESNIPSAQAAA